MSLRPLYVVLASDSQPHGLLGAHCSLKAARAHYESVRADRRQHKPGYEWGQDRTAHARPDVLETLMEAQVGAVTIWLVRCP